MPKMSGSKRNVDTWFQLKERTIFDLRYLYNRIQYELVYNFPSHHRFDKFSREFLPFIILPILKEFLIYIFHNEMH